MTNEKTPFAGVDAEVQAIADDYRAQDELCESMGRLLLGTSVTTPGGTLAVIRLLRDTLEYLESRYAKQVGQARQARETAAAPAGKPAPARSPTGAKRGRKPRANGATTPAPAPAGLPFGSAEPAGEPAI
jgi:hypothetical protein